MECAVWLARVTTIAATANPKGGSTNATAVTTGRSGFWQQDMEQAVRPLISWSQSRVDAECAGPLW
jgi:hypothetical protein